MEPTAHQPLRTAALVFAAGFAVHNADHVRRGVDAITNEVNTGGLVVAMASAVILTLVFTRHRLAPFAAAGALGIAVGVSLTHLLPDWGVLSDPLTGGDVDAVTWIAVVAEIVGAVVLGVTGLRIVRRQGYLVVPATT